MPIEGWSTLCARDEDMAYGGVYREPLGVTVAVAEMIDMLVALGKRRLHRPPSQGYSFDATLLVMRDKGIRAGVAVICAKA